jgi:hypothetical protein
MHLPRPRRSLRAYWLWLIGRFLPASKLLELNRR